MIIACPRCGASYELDAAAFGSRPRTVRCSSCGFEWQQAPERASLAEKVAATRRESAASAAAEPAPAPATEAVGSGTPGAESKADALSVDAATRGAGAPVPEASDSSGATDADDGPAFGSGADDDPATSSDADEDDEAAAPSPPPAAAGWRRRLPRSRVAVAAFTSVATVCGLCALLVLLRGTIMAVLPAATRLYDIVGLAPDPLGEGLQIRDVASARERKGSKDLITVTGAVVNIAPVREPVPYLRVSLWDASDEELRLLVVQPGVAMLAPGESWAFTASIDEPAEEVRRVRVGFAQATSP